MSQQELLCAPPPLPQKLWWLYIFAWCAARVRYRYGHYFHPTNNYFVKDIRVRTSKNCQE